MLKGATVPAPVDGGRPRQRAVLTGCYLVVLLLTTLAVHLVPTATADALLDASSTDVWHLVHRPLRVLVASALWLPDEGWEATAVVLTVAMAALERRVGARRTLLVFASGHVLATLLTEVPLGAATLLGLLPSSAAHRLDVGVSYGTFAVVGALARLLPVRLRVAVLAGAVALVAVPLVEVHGLTSVGHALALLVGVAWWPSLRRSARPDEAGPGQRTGVAGSGAHPARTSGKLDPGSESAPGAAPRSTRSRNAATSPPSTRSPRRPSMLPRA